MTPPPMNPIPETIWAAMREGSRTTRPVSSMSVKPYLGTSMISADEKSDERISAQTGTLLAYLALKPDYRGQHEGESKFG
jgi:hypothetical protein